MERSSAMGARVECGECGATFGFEEDLRFCRYCGTLLERPGESDDDEVDGDEPDDDEPDDDEPDDDEPDDGE